MVRDCPVIFRVFPPGVLILSGFIRQWQWVKGTWSRERNDLSDPTTFVCVPLRKAGRPVALEVLPVDLNAASPEERQAARLEG